MACYDCEDCSKDEEVDGVRPCKQPYSYTCPFNAIKENMEYMDTIKEVLIKLNEAKNLIVKARKKDWDMEEYYDKIKFLIQEIKDETDEDLIKEYKELYGLF